MNRVELLGRLTKDAIINEGTTGKGKDAIAWKNARFTLAVDRANNREKADFISCIAWAGLADLIQKYVNKGDQLAVEGCIETRSYEDENKKMNYVTEVRVTGLTLIAQGKNDPKSEEYEEYDEDRPARAKANRRGR